MGNLLCCNKKDDLQKDDLQKPILKSTVFCPYCKNTYMFNEYYSHYYDCKKKHINKEDIHGEL